MKVHILFNAQKRNYDGEYPVVLGVFLEPQEPLALSLQHDIDHPKFHHWTETHEVSLPGLRNPDDQESQAL